MSESAKQRVGDEVAGWAEDGMVVGLGTGSTAVKAIEALGRRVRAGEVSVRGVATSFFAERAARAAGITLVTLDEVDGIDMAFDGADEVTPSFDLIKGRGAAHTREKIVASVSRRFVVLVDESKLVSRLGTVWPVPVEVHPMALAPVSRNLTALGAEVVLRIASKKDGPVVTDQGFWVVDARFDGIDDVRTMDRLIKMIPGVLDHGIFVDLATDVLIGRNDGEIEHRVRRA